MFCNYYHYDYYYYLLLHVLFSFNNSITHSYLYTYQRVICKQCGPRSDATICGV